METKMDRESSLQNWNVYSPQRQNNLIFFWLPYTVTLARLLLQSTPGEQCSETLLRSSPTLQTLQTLPLPRPLAFVRFDPPACRAGLTSAGLEAADQVAACWAGFTSPVAMSCVMVYVLLCCWGVFPVLTLYSPRSIVWGLFFFSSLSSCHAVFFFNSTCISLLIILCMIVYVTNNKEPWTLNEMMFAQSMYVCFCFFLL